jgi:hypothetical protein
MGDLVSFQVDRGRSYERERTETGTATLRLNDNAGAYDIVGPNASGLKPSTQAVVAWEHPTRGTVEPIFTGFAEDYDSLRRSPRQMTTMLSLVDGFELLGAARVSGATQLERFYEAQPVDDRIFAAAADATWPVAWLNVFSGNVRMQRKNYAAGTSCLQVMRDAADAEFPGVANLFMKRTGELAFRGRFARFNPGAYGIPTWRLGDVYAFADDPSIIPIHYEGMGWNSGQQAIVNSAMFCPEGVDPKKAPQQLFQDQTSIDDMGFRSYEQFDLLVLEHLADGTNAMEQCRLYAKWYRDGWAQPVPRVPTLKVHPFAGLDRSNAEYVWDFVLTAEIGDLCLLNTTHPGGGGFTDELFFIEGIHHTARSLNETTPWWEMSLDLSPAAPYAIGFPTDPTPENGV